MFVLPFLLLMSATMKRNARMLGTMCAIMLLCHFLEIYWIVQPEAGAHGARALHPPLEWLWIDLSVVLLLGGLCGVMFISNFRKAALLPVMDPRLVEALSAEHVEEIEHADAQVGKRYMSDAKRTTTPQDALKIAMGVAGAGGRAADPCDAGDRPEVHLGRALGGGGGRR